VDENLSNDQDIVGASLLAMVVNDDAAVLNVRDGLRLFASKLAPTVNLRCMKILRPPRTL